MKQYDKFYSYLQELDQSYTRLGDLLRQKLTALMNFDLKKLDEIMKEEQVYVLLSKGFDTSLDAYRDNLHLKGNTLGEVIEELPPDKQDSFRAQYKRLKSTLDEVKLLNEKCQDILQDRLHDLDDSIKSLDKSGNPTYQKTGGASPDGTPPSGLFTKSI